jgi:hypothetical protein
MYRVLIRLLTFQFVIIQILFKSKNNLILETLELRQQLIIYQTKKEDSKNITAHTARHIPPAPVLSVPGILVHYRPGV